SVASADVALEPANVCSESAGMLFVNRPTVEEVTSIFTVHVPLAGITAGPSSATDVSPAAAVTLPPAHVVCALGGAAATMPLPIGNTSVSEPVSVVEMPFGLPSVITSVLVLPI